MMNFPKTKISLLVTLLILATNITFGQALFGYDGLLKEVKENYRQNEYTVAIIKIADKYLRGEISTIADIKSPLGEDYKNAYYSESPYWWENPHDPDGPYIRHDGKRNPERFGGHKQKLMEMYQAVTSLAFAAYLTGEDKYSARFKEFVNAWFIDKTSRMEPHLKYAQMIRNRNRIRGVGIIETHRFTGLVEALLLLKSTGMIEKEFFSTLDNWMEEYYTWLTESKWGIDEKERGNNHSSWWAAQSASIAFYLGKENDLKEFFEYGKNFLVDNQITKECRQPLEDERTLSMNYNTFNLNALSFLSRVLDKSGYDLYNYINNDGSGLVCAAERFIPFLLNPESWELTQIKPYHKKAQPFLVFIGKKTGNEKFLEIYKKLALQDGLNDDDEDPLLLLMAAQIMMNN